MGLFFLAPYGVGNGMDATNPVLYTNSPQCSTAPPMVELTKLERQAEDTFETINGLHRTTTAGASIFAYLFGCVAALVLGGGMCLCMLIENSVPAFAGGIILGVFGIALCGMNYFIYKKLVAKKIKTLLPIIDETEEKLANLLE